MRAVVCQFIYEANTFCAQQADEALFRDGGVWREGAAAVRAWSDGVDSQTGGSLRAFADAGWDAEAVFAAQCGSPSGRLSAACFAAIREAFVRCLRAALPADALVLHLHGAAAAVGEDDAEGALLELVRDGLGFRGPLVLSLDLHANMTRRMARHADAVTAYRTMPHMDFSDTGARAARLAVALAAGRPSRRAVAKIRALVPPIDTTHVDGRFADLLALARAAESADDAIDDVCVLPVQPWLDVDELGSAIVVTGRGAAPAATARRLAETWYAQRREWGGALRPWPEIIARLTRPDPPSRERPWVLVDACDATTGGSDGASAEILLRLLPHADRLPGQVLLTVVDPATVAAARAGATSFVIGAQRVAVSGTVVHLGDGAYRASGRLYPNAPFSMRGAAVISVGNLRLVAACAPSMAIDDAYYACVGLDARSALAVQSKSIMSWRAAFAAEPDDGLYFDGPGQTPLDVRRLTFTGNGRGCFPNDAEPREPITVYGYG